MDEAEVRRLLRRQCEMAGSQKAWAEKHKVSTAYVSDALNQRCELGDALLKGLGVKRVVTYRMLPKAERPDHAALKAEGC